MKNLPRLYLDMDGVLVNFEKQLEDTIKMPISKWMKLDSKARWDPVIARKDFWSSMPWLPEGKKLFRLPNPDVPTKNGAVNVTAFAPAPDAITDDCSVLDGIVAVYPAC